MILKQLLNSQLLKLAKEFKKQHKEIWDIAIYGSVIRGKIIAKDIDVAIIFSSSEKLEKKLTLSQLLRGKMKKLIKYDIDVKGIDINDLFNSSFIARKAIIAESFLLIQKKFLHEIFGFENFWIFSYSLKGLNASKKMMFHYSLRGRRGQKGLLYLSKSISLGKGVIKVPLQYSEEFKEFFEKNNIKYKIYHGLLY